MTRACNMPGLGCRREARARAKLGGAHGATARAKRGAAEGGLTLVRAVAAFALLLAAASAIAEPPREVHGSGDLFAMPGIVLAWGILRGSSDATTTVVVRVAADPAAYRSLAVAGIDPFTRTEAPLQPPTRVEGTLDVRVPRARYAELPRTEFRFSAAQDAPQPALVVFYVGVPDTTPEFADATRLDAYLAERIARARAGGTKEQR